MSASAYIGFSPLDVQTGPDPAVAKGQMKRKRKTPRRKELKLLIADDSAAVRASLAAHCDFDGLNVVGQAKDGEQAMIAFNVHDPDIVILDLHMPKIGGLEVLRRIKTDKPKCCVIVLTAAASDLVAEHCLKLGADYFFDKATEVDLALDTLQRLACA